MASLGSISYAEDEGRHVVGIKTAQPATTAASTLSGADTSTPPDSDGKFCCHVLECENEVILILPTLCTYCHWFLPGFDKGGGSSSLFLGE